MASRSVESRRQTGTASEHPVVRWWLTGTALAIVALFLVIPLAIVFTEALAKGPIEYLKAIFQDEALQVYRQLAAMNPGDVTLQDRVRALEGGARTSMSFERVSRLPRPRARNRNVRGKSAS